MKSISAKGILLSSFLILAAAGCNSAPPSKGGQDSTVDAFGPGVTIYLDKIKEEFIEKKIDVKIYFAPKNRNTTKLCPRYVDWPNIKLVERFEKPDVDGKKGIYINKITWEALTIDGDEYKGGFKLVFSPFRSHIVGDGGTGKISLKDIPEIVLKFFDRGFDMEFKYTVIGLECRGQPLDPRIRVL